MEGQAQCLLRHIRDTYAVEEEYLWARYPDYAVCRHPASGKWFAIFMAVSQSRLGLEGEEAADVLNVKCSPLLIGSLLSAGGFLPAYHMNKGSWISILLDDSVPNSQIAALLEWSYDSAAPKPRRRKNTKKEEKDA